MALYVRHVIRKLKDEVCDVSLLTTRSAIAHPSFQMLKTELKNVELHFLPELPLISDHSSLSLFLQQLKSWLIVRREFAQIIARKKFAFLLLSLRGSEVIWQSIYICMDCFA